MIYCIYYNDTWLISNLGDFVSVVGHEVFQRRVSSRTVFSDVDGVFIEMTNSSQTLQLGGCIFYHRNQYMR